MREILFKAKRLDNGEWVCWNIYGELCRLSGKRTRLAIKNGATTHYYDYIYQVIERIDKNTICQYTGLTDKNGNKIWENDVVKQSFYKILENEIESEEISGCEIGAVVIIPTKGTCMKNPLQYVEVNGEIEKNFEKVKMYKGVCQYRCEVIGNIFDNADLLQ